MVNKEINKQAYFVNLDAMRFFAALAVLIFHYFAFLEQNELFSSVFQYIKPIVSKGHLGVNFFFVLSAFLISLLVFREIEKSGNFSIRYFLIRRTLRIWPLYFIVVIASFLLVHFLPIYGVTQHEPIWFAFFLSNFGEIQNGVGDAYTQLTIPWSVSIEEQFYLFWALIIGGFSITRKHTFLYFFIALLLGSLFFRWMHFDEERILYYHTFSAVTDLSIGALTAYYFHYNFHVFKKWVTAKRTVLIGIYIIITLLIVFKNKLFHHGIFIVLERPVIAICFAWIIGRQLIYASIWKGKTKKVAVYLGKISYGIYMIHCLVLFIIEIIFFKYELGKSVIFLLPLGALVTFGLSHISYKYIESYFLRLKKNYQKY